MQKGHVSYHLQAAFVPTLLFLPAMLALNEPFLTSEASRDAPSLFNVEARLAFEEAVPFIIGFDRGLRTLLFQSSVLSLFTMRRAWLAVKSPSGGGLLAEAAIGLRRRWSRLMPFVE